MLREFAATLKGILCVCLVVLYALIALTPVMLIALAKWLVRSERAKHRCTHLVIAICEGLARAYAETYRVIHRPQWDLQGLEGLSPANSYLIICNHQSWSDIPIMIFALIGRVPFYKFFLKQELIWLPLIGTTCWALDFPFMQRYSKEELANNPELRGRDLAATRQLCAKLRGEPVSIVNYIEGTRFRPEKKAKQGSPYNYLLKPKSGGLAYVITNLGESLEALLDITIIYPEGRQGFWQFLSGRLEKVVVRVEQRAIPPHLLHGDYQASESFREEFRQWVAGLWQEKDAVIGSYLS